MKKLVTLLAAGTLLAIFASSAMASNALRISQVYGGGGSASSGPTYNVDYVEIFNNSGSPISLSGYTIEYGSSTGNWGSSSGNIFTFPAAAVIQPCSYILVASSTASAGGGPLPITPDYTFSINASATQGKVALFNAVNSNVACGSELAGTLVDKVAYGASATCAEGTSVATLSTTTGAVRNNGGVTDTDNNSADFTVTTNPVPRNSQSSQNPNCLSTPTIKSTWGALKSIYR
jgi:hypothetical protein